MEHRPAQIEILRAAQNADGGWGYFPGKRSWLEPTVYAVLALANDPDSSSRVQAGWNLVRSWQNPDGGWRPTAAVAESGWVTALALSLADILGEQGPDIERGARWLMLSAGVESSTLNRLLRFCRLSNVERGIQNAGWPWRAGTSAWVEPTAHSLVALKKWNRRNPDRAVAARIRTGEQMLLDVRCPDGGWNYGSPRALGIDLPSYAETTALALLGLQDSAPPQAIGRARELLRNGQVGPLAQAWLRIAVGLYGPIQEEARPPMPHSRDLLLCALQAIDGRRLRSGLSQ